MCSHSVVKLHEATVLSVLYACVLYFCICTCSVQLSMFHMERRSRNTLIIIIIIIINYLTLVSSLASGSCVKSEMITKEHEFFSKYLLVTLCLIATRDKSKTIIEEHTSSLVMVKASASKVEGPGSNPACDRIFSGPSHTSDLKIGTPVATLPGIWRYRSALGLVGPVSVYCDWVR